MVPNGSGRPIDRLPHRFAALGVDDPLTRSIPNIWRDTPAPYGPLFLIMGILSLSKPYCTYDTATGALYLHSLVVGLVDTAAISERDVLLPIVPMFHVNAWGMPFAATWYGAGQVYGGPAPTPADYLRLIREAPLVVVADEAGNSGGRGFPASKQLMLPEIGDIAFYCAYRCAEWFGAGINAVGIGSQLFKGASDPAVVTARVAPLMRFISSLQK